MMKAGEPLMKQAVEALKRYHEAQDAGAPVAEIERLRVEADSLFQAVADFAQYSLEGPAGTIH
ncbi:MAG TPA: hypothetical protein VJS90_07835 [Pseudomonas sp.]|nr:hypothetical protein [Pseudomonas sp.]HKS12938.1 hypothetical protein [Pseudomonas sp.]